MSGQHAQGGTRSPDQLTTRVIGHCAQSNPCHLLKVVIGGSDKVETVSARELARLPRRRADRAQVQVGNVVGHLAELGVTGRLDKSTLYEHATHEPDSEPASNPRRRVKDGPAERLGAIGGTIESQSDQQAGKEPVVTAATDIVLTSFKDRCGLLTS